VGNVFSLDGKMYKIGTVLWDFVVAGLLWVVFSLPIVTIGASTTALYYAFTKKSAGEDDFIMKGFWKSFKANFVKATAIFFIIAAATFVLWMNIFILGQQDLGWLNVPVTFALYFVLMQIAFMSIYAFGILARFEMTAVGALRAGLFMAYRYFAVTVVNALLLAVAVLGSMFIPEVLVFLIGGYICLSSSLLVKVFRRHDPDFGKLA